jgi:hypothetical protein
MSHGNTSSGSGGFQRDGTVSAALGSVKILNPFPPSRAFTIFVKKTARNRLRMPSIRCIGGAPVRKITLLLTVVLGGAFAVSASAAQSDSLNFKPRFIFKDKSGKTVSAPVVDEYEKKKLVFPTAKVDPRLDPKLMRAASIAQERAHAHSKYRRLR